MAKSVIDLEHVAKSYPSGVDALRGVAMQVMEGEIFGLLGPNGAGKSTLVKILLTLVRASECQGKMLDHHIGHRATLGRIGYMPEQARFPDYLTGRQVLDFTGGLMKVPFFRRHKRAKELLELTGVAKAADRKLSTYSKGMKQRLGIAQALINKPDLVFLDEPADGLDPIGRREMADLLRELRRRGVTVFLNSHLLGEAERLCDRVAILSAGRIVRQGTVEELTNEGRTYEVKLEGSLPPIPSLEQLVFALGGKIRFSREDHSTTITLRTSRSQLLQPVIDELRRFGITIDAIMPKKRTLEEFFLATVSGNAPDRAIETLTGTETLVGSKTLQLRKPNVATSTGEATLHG